MFLQLRNALVVKLGIVNTKKAVSVWRNCFVGDGFRTKLVVQEMEEVITDTYWLKVWEYSGSQCSLVK
jgi:hypothetical protein